MSAPKNDYEDPLHGALCEIISAQSSLNMYPAPIEGPPRRYLSESDEWAQHAMEHLHAAFDLIARALKERIKEELTP